MVCVSVLHRLVTCDARQKSMTHWHVPEHGDRQVQRVTLQLQGCLDDDETWRGDTGFRRVLDDPECYESFRAMLR